MSFLKKLFGGGGGTTDAPKDAGREEYKDFVIRATPYKEGGQYQLCGVIEKTIGVELKSYKYIRADKFAGLDEAASFTLSKGRQIIDEQGERIFQ
jgi:hypothetical protein